MWFNNAYNHGWFSPLLQPHTGYLQTFPRLVADLGLLVPLRRLPALFTLVALGVQVLPAVVLVSRRCARLVPQFWVRVVLAVLYLAVPNSSEINVNLTNAQWHLAVLALLVVLAGRAGKLWTAFDVAVIVLSGLTGPFVLALLPVAAVVWYRRRERPWVPVLVAGLAAIQLLELVLNPSGRAHLGPLGITGRRTVEILGGQMVGSTVFGNASVASPAAAHRFLVISIVCAVVGAVVVALVLWRAPLELKLLNGFVALVSAGSLATPVVAATGSQWQILTTHPNLRYWFLPALVVLVDLVWLAGQRRMLHGAVAVLGAAIMAVTVVVGVRTDFRIAPLPKPDWAAEVAAFAKVPKGTVFQFQIAPSGFPMSLVKR